MKATPESIQRSKDFLCPFLEQLDARITDYPIVTLTWAQSLDGYLTQVAGSPTPISGPESLALTHYLRSVNEGILVGITTVMTDNPSLGCRLPSSYGSWTSPRPIVLDSRLRIPLDCRLIQEKRGLVVIASQTLHDPVVKDELEGKGVKVLLVEDGVNSEGIDLRQALQKLSLLGIRRLMVEGGPSVLSSFLSQKFGHLLVLTIAPKFFLDGVSLKLKTGSTLEVRERATMHLGPDVIVAGFL